MRILVVTQYFWPESFIINDVVRALVAQGHHVEVLTGKPNYPDGVVFPGYVADGCERESFGDGIPVYRIPLRPRGKGGAKRLVLNYLSFVWSGLRYSPGLLSGRRFDAILVFAPSPITSAIPAIWLKWRMKAHLALWVQDLWPESLSATGFVRNRLVLRLVGTLVRVIYACADTLLVQSNAFRGAVAQYAHPRKIVYYPNCLGDVGPCAGPAGPASTALIATLSAKFSIVFAGNLGAAQSLETIVGAAERLRNLREVQLVMIGSGSRADWLEQQKTTRNLENLVLAGRFPPEDMPAFFSCAGALLVTLKQEEIFSYTIPSKIQAYLAAGKPILAALDGEGARIVEEAAAGLTCSAEDAEGLAQCIKRIYQMTGEERERFGESGRAYFLEHFELQRQAGRLVEILNQRISEGATHTSGQ